MLEQIIANLKHSAEIEGEEYKWKCLRNDEVEWLLEQAQQTDQLKKVNLVATHLMSEEQRDKLRRLTDKNYRSTDVVDVNPEKMVSS